MWNLSLESGDSCTKISSVECNALFRYASHGGTSEPGNVVRLSQFPSVVTYLTMISNFRIRAKHPCEGMPFLPRTFPRVNCATTRRAMHPTANTLQPREDACTRRRNLFHESAVLGFRPCSVSGLFVVTTRNETPPVSMYCKTLRYLEWKKEKNVRGILIFL